MGCQSCAERRRQMLAAAQRAANATKTKSTEAKERIKKVLKPLL